MVELGLKYYNGHYTQIFENSHNEDYLKKEISEYYKGLIDIMFPIASKIGFKDRQMYLKIAKKYESRVPPSELFGVIKVPNKFGWIIDEVVTEQTKYIQKLIENKRVKEYTEYLCTRNYTVQPI